jgi:hypothetical protein
MSDERLERFVREALGNGIERHQIRATLLQARWREDEVEAALATFAEVDFPLPVPRPKPYLSARDAFAHLVLFTALYTSAIAFIKVVYQFIHRAFPDAAASWRAAEAASSGLRWSTAALLIAFPLFLWLSRRSYHANRKDPENRTSKVRKWLTYLTLFVAASTLMCDLIALVYHLLGGELTERFLLKALVVGTVAGAVFGYYLWDLRQDDVKPGAVASRHHGVRVFVSAVVLLVGVTLVGGLVLAGSPVLARSERLDQLRLQHLSAAADSIDNYWQLEGKLPPDLETLARRRTGAPNAIRDPVTRSLYGYTPGDGARYRLCATFDTADSDPQIHWQGKPFWAHPAGHHCYEIEVSSGR